jgi:hypothetical protein
MKIQFELVGDGINELNRLLTGEFSQYIDFITCSGNHINRSNTKFELTIDDLKFPKSECYWITEIENRDLILNIASQIFDLSDHILFTKINDSIQLSVDLSKSKLNDLLSDFSSLFDIELNNVIIPITYFDNNVDCELFKSNLNNKKIKMNYLGITYAY